MEVNWKSWSPRCWANRLAECSSSAPGRVLLGQPILNFIMTILHRDNDQ